MLHHPTTPADFIPSTPPTRGKKTSKNGNIFIKNAYGKCFQFIFCSLLIHLNPHMPPDPLLAPIAAHMHEYFIKTGKIVFSYYKLLAHASHYFYAMYIFCALCWRGWKYS